MRVAIIVLGVLLSSAATGEPQPWMKKEDPETLHFFAFANPGCPFSNAELTELVNGVLIRSRLRPGKFPMSLDTLAFQVSITCLETANEFFAYNTDIYFVRIAFGRKLLESYPLYGKLGIGGGGQIMQSAKSSVEDLVTDYLQANFDLTPE